MNEPGGADLGDRDLTELRVSPRQATSAYLNVPNNGTKSAAKRLWDRIVGIVRACLGPIKTAPLTKIRKLRATASRRLTLPLRNDCSALVRARWRCCFNATRQQSSPAAAPAPARASRSHCPS